MWRRDFLGYAGMSALPAITPRWPHLAAAFSPAGGVREQDAVERLRQGIAALPVDDTHCHPISDKDAQTTVRQFLERLALSAFPAASYFPRGVLRRFQTGTPAEREALDREYGIEKVLAEIDYHFSESVFVKFMVKELAAFLGCAPRLDAVVEARNARTAVDYFGTSRISFETPGWPM